MAALGRILGLIPLRTTPCLIYTAINSTRNWLYSPIQLATNQKFTNFSILASNYTTLKRYQFPTLLTQFQFPIQEQQRNLTKFSWKSGKRKTVRAVTKRFFRLRWGTWIRTRAGKNKHLWKKSAARKRRLQKHVFCNRTQSRLFDHMTTKFWKKKRYYFNDPYEPYHKRHNIYRGD